MSISVKSGTSGESGNKNIPILSTVNKLDELILEMSGIEDLLGIVAEAEDSGKRCAIGIYLLADAQNHIVESLRKVSESLYQEIRAERESKNIPSV